MEFINLNNEEELKELITNNHTILMIHKTHCPFCEKAMPWMEDFSKIFENIKLAQINKDDMPTLLEAFQVQMYPTFVAIKEGKVEDIFFGDTKYEKVKEFIEKQL